MAVGDSFDLRLVGGDVSEGLVQTLIDKASESDDAYAQFLADLGDVPYQALFRSCLIASLQDADNPAGDLLHKTIHIFVEEDRCGICRLVRTNSLEDTADPAEAATNLELHVGDPPPAKIARTDWV